MPTRYANGTRTKFCFLASADMKMKVMAACRATNTPSMQVYLQHAMIEALGRDLGLDVEEMLAAQPPTRAEANILQKRAMVSGSGTNETVY